jgi:uncharacterized protein
MQFTEDSGFTETNLIRTYGPGQITIRSTTYRHSLIVSAQTLMTDWPPQALAELTTAHLDALLALKPEVILLGVGPILDFPPPALLAYVTSRGVGLEVMDTPAACRTYNVLLSEGRNVVIGLLLS